MPSLVRKKMPQSAFIEENATSVCVSVCEWLFTHDQRKLILCRLRFSIKRSCGHWSLMLFFFSSAGVHFQPSGMMITPELISLIRLQTAHDSLYSFTQSFSHRVICWSHQIILYEGRLRHICP